MPRITTKRRLNHIVTLMELNCPAIARKAKPGQFVMVRPDQFGERIPLTIADYDAVRGTITIMYQRLGVTTNKLDAMNVGDSVLDVAGPLGHPTQTEGVKRAVVIGGGVGCAIAYPQAKALHAAGVHVDVIIGFRSKELVFMEDSFRRNCTNLYITTDDGSYGERGFVNKKLEQLLEAGNQYDVAIAIGPIPMMRAVSQSTLPYKLKTIVSLNPIMVDGTGMCGCCRCTVGGQLKFACVDGPDFDGHQVDFDELIIRTGVYRTQENAAHQRHQCNLQRMADELKAKERGGE
ncbi:MAG: sulfide/dihydroorotate dehydrogenase-like FAD/NAD-binding protein [Oscillospiraceae bacterium]|nr:sulfide/dihydroorotate dehydrogenase-like FAD/NAD-binding protein [Oscillospiraceae bacterium]